MEELLPARRTRSRAQHRYRMSDLTLTPIGTSPAWYNPGEPNSGFVLEADGARVLVDCGAGVVMRLLELYGADVRLDGVVISHLHADHCMDLVPLKYGIDFSGSLDHLQGMELWLPPDGPRRLATIASAWDLDESMFHETFTMRTYEPGATFDVGPFRAAALEVPHFIDSHALRFQHGDASFGYTADLAPAPSVAPFMRDVDLLLSEACSDESTRGAPGRGHITASEAGDLAREAGAHSLLLTHVPDKIGADEAVRNARTTYDGPVAAASSGEPYVVAGRLARAV